MQIRETPLTKCAGVDANCQGLIGLFEGDDDVQMLPTIEYTRHTIPILHQYYLDPTEIYESIDKYKPDIIHIHGAYSFTLYVAVKCAKKRNIPIVFSPHFHPFWSLRRPFMGKLFFKVVTQRVLADIKTIFTINNEDSVFFRKYHSNVVKLPHWSKYKLLSTRPEKNPKMILFVGRLNETNKGFEHIYHLPEGKYEIHCVGKGEIIQRSDIIRHTSLSDEQLSKLYQQASLLVVPSRYEAFSFVSLEALASYTPVLMSNRVRIADYIYGMNGVGVFRYQDYNDFVKKVDIMIEQTVDAKRIIDIFSPNEIRDKYKYHYLSAANIKAK